MILRWHLHVTVKPHWSWTLSDVASALRRDIERHGMHPIVVTNHFRDDRSPYRELIPSKEIEGDEACASREIFRMGVILNNAGWRVKRLKIEGDARVATVATRALYFETHLKIDEWPAPMSTNVRGERIFTLRRPTVQAIEQEIMELAGTSIEYQVEACTLDTNPDMDKEWISQ